MFLTRIWAAILAVLATACLAGMFLLSASNGADFSDADRAAIQALTEAGVAALEAQVQSSPVQRANRVARSRELTTALAKIGNEGGPAVVDDVVAELAEELRVETRSDDITLAVADHNGTVVSANGIADRYIAEVASSDAYREARPTEEPQFAIALGGELHVARLTAADAAGRRVVAVAPLRTGAGSVFRRVLGSTTPAGLVRKGQVLGDIIGDQPVTKDLERLATEHLNDTPDEGASQVFLVGDGLNARIGALGRLPGPAGHGRNGTVLAVVSRHTLAASKKDLAQALGDAQRKALGSVNWLLLVGLLGTSLALALYLPELEALGPLRRLGKELDSVAQGKQHQIFHERYSGAPAVVARSAALALDGLRQAFLAELEIDQDVENESEHTGTRPRAGRGKTTHSGRKVESTRRPTVVGRSTPSLRIPKITSREQPVSSESTEPPEELETTVHDPEPSVSVRTPAPSMPRPMPVEPSTSERWPEPSKPAPAVPERRPAAESWPPPPSLPAPPEPRSSVEPRPAPQAQQRRPTPAAPTATIVAPSISAATRSPAPPFAPPPAARPRAPEPPAPPIAPPPTPAKAPAFITGPGPADEDSQRTAYYREVYDEFVQVKQACGEPTESLTFERFVAKLRKNEKDLRATREDIREVRFSVYVKDGKAALKARVVRTLGDDSP